MCRGLSRWWRRSRSNAAKSCGLKSFEPATTRSLTSRHLAALRVIYLHFAPVASNAKRRQLTRSVVKGREVGVGGSWRIFPEQWPEQGSFGSKMSKTNGISSPCTAPRRSSNCGEGQPNSYM
jgi:hypothetical protein